MSIIKTDKLQKMTFALLIAIVLLLSCCIPALASSVDAAQVRSAPLAADSITKDGMVRVYLSSLGNPTTLDLTVNGNYSLSHNGEFIANGSRLTVLFSPSSGNIALSYNGQTINMGKSFSLRRHSAAGANGILIAQSRDSQNPYPGDLSFEAVSNGNGYTLYTIAHIYIENYLYGVLPYEMGNSSGIEALKAQAVAARTYTVRMMDKRASGRYDVKDTTSDQVYRGTPSGNANCVAAVDATKGIVLMYGSDYITTYYSASNGGQTETARTGTAYAYMKVKDDPFDYANPNATVKKKTLYADLTHSANPSQLIALLKNKAIASLQRSGYPATADNTVPTTLKNVTPHTPMYDSPSRLYTKIDFSFTVSTKNAAGQSTMVTLTETCGIFTELESMLGMGIQSTQNELWSVEKGDGTFVLQARRYGHGMGMSQRGAMYMAKLGYTYDQILGFYYDGCKRVRHSFTNTILNASSSDQQITVEPPADLEEDAAVVTQAIVSTSSGSLNMRSLPQAGSRIITTIPRGAEVTVTAQSDAWSAVRYGGYSGYVMSKYLSFADAAPEVPPQTDESTSSLKATVVTPSGTLNLRSQKHTGSQILERIPPYTVLNVLERGVEWCMVEYLGTKGYVMTKFLSFDQTDDTAKPDEEAEQPEESAKPEATVLPKATVNTQSGSLNLRRQPSTMAEVITSMPQYAEVILTAYGDEWCAVRYGSFEGYAMTRYLRLEGKTEQPPAEAPDEEQNEDNVETKISMWVKTPGGSLNLRSKSDGNSAVLTTIPQNAQVTLLASGDVWSSVSYGGYTGFVMSRFLSDSEPATEGDDEQPVQMPLGDGNAAEPAKPFVTVAGIVLDVTLQIPSTAAFAIARDDLPLYSMCDESAEILFTVPEGEQVEIILTGELWCLVDYQGVQGYCLTPELSVMNE